MAWFKNLRVFLLPMKFEITAEVLLEHCAGHPAREPGPLEVETMGFASPFGTDDPRIGHVADPYVLLKAQTHSRMLPASVVSRELDKRVKETSARESRRVGGKERKRLKEEIVSELLPRAFISTRAFSGVLDRTNGWVIVDTSSRPAAESFVSLMRETLGRFPAAPPAPEESPRALMTDWLIKGTLPNGFVLGDEVELRDPAEAGAIWRGRRQDLESDEVKEHLKAGKQVFQLGLEFAERLSFVLSEDLSIRKLRMHDVVLDALSESASESSDAELIAQFGLMSLEINALLKALTDIFGLQQPAERDA
ncbi:MAG: recombination-associated protein RdgC [Dokdonella sp.]